MFLNAGSDMAPVFSGSTPVMVGEPGAKAAINLGARATIAVTGRMKTGVWIWWPVHWTAKCECT